MFFMCLSLLVSPSDDMSLPAHKWAMFQPSGRRGRAGGGQFQRIVFSEFALEARHYHTQMSRILLVGRRDIKKHQS